MPHPWKKTPLRDLRTLGASRAVRWDRCDYCGDEIIHLIIRAEAESPFNDPELAKIVCRSVETSAQFLKYELFGYCLMPDHLHVLVSPNSTGKVVGDWLQKFKSFF